ncbi:phage portal protein [Comamonas sp. EJ-4]|uniref:Phage portal protein n=2 Tax=Comamonas suwonensis TaxID=2606214 RepID=A0A843B5R4_9BURK|nr:phage portal protein [Comamonas suwonensis]
MRAAAVNISAICVVAKGTRVLRSRTWVSISLYTDVSCPELSRAPGTWRAMPSMASSWAIKLCTGFKAQVLASTFKPHKLLSTQTVHKLVLDYLVFGNGYLERPRNVLGEGMQLRHALGKYVRRHRDLERFVFVRNWQEAHEFRRGSVCHMMEPDVHQEVYGLPQYLAALQSALLNESATLFRRRYYTNGSHAGYILYLTDPDTNQGDVDKLRDALKSSKGLGNFKNLFFHSPNGKEKGIQLIPIGEAAAKDEFFNIKNVSRDDQLAAHRVPPQLMGLVPTNASGFGDVVNAARVFARNEIQPLQEMFSHAINDFMGDTVCALEPYRLPGVEEIQPGGLVK